MNVTYIHLYIGTEPLTILVYETYVWPDWLTDTSEHSTTYTDAGKFNHFPLVMKAMRAEETKWIVDDN